MDQGKNDWKPPQALTPEWIEFVDGLYKSPSQRAGIVHGSIDPNISQFDLLCFCIEYTSGFAVGYFAETDLYHAMKIAARWLYAQHYFGAPTIHGSPDLKRDSTERSDIHGVHPVAQGDQQTLRTPQGDSEGAGQGPRPGGPGLEHSPEVGIPAEGSGPRGAFPPRVRTHSPASNDTHLPSGEQHRPGDPEVHAGDGEVGTTDPSVGEVRSEEIDDSLREGGESD